MSKRASVKRVPRAEIDAVVARMNALPGRHQLRQHKSGEWELVKFDDSRFAATLEAAFGSPKIEISVKGDTLAPIIEWIAARELHLAEQTDLREEYYATGALSRGEDYAEWINATRAERGMAADAEMVDRARNDRLRRQREERAEEERQARYDRETDERYDSPEAVRARAEEEEVMWARKRSVAQTMAEDEAAKRGFTIELSEPVATTNTALVPVAAVHQCTAQDTRSDDEVGADGAAALVEIARLIDDIWQPTLRLAAACVRAQEYGLVGSNTGKPNGPRFSTRQTEWLAQHGLGEDVLTTGDRKSAISIITNLPAVEAWRNGLSPRDRSNLTTPRSIWQAFSKAAKKTKPVVKAAKPVLLSAPADTELARLRAENRVQAAALARVWAGETVTEAQVRAEIEAAVQQAVGPVSARAQELRAIEHLNTVWAVTGVSPDDSLPDFLHEPLRVVLFADADGELHPRESYAVVQGDTFLDVWIEAERLWRAYGGEADAIVEVDYVSDRDGDIIKPIWAKLSAPQVQWSDDGGDYMADHAFDQAEEDELFDELLAEATGEDDEA